MEGGFGVDYIGDYYRGCEGGFPNVWVSFCGVLMIRNITNLGEGGGTCEGSLIFGR